MSRNLAIGSICTLINITLLATVQTQQLTDENADKHDELRATATQLVSEYIGERASISVNCSSRAVFSKQFDNINVLNPEISARDYDGEIWRAHFDTFYFTSSIAEKGDTTATILRDLDMYFTYDSARIVRIESSVDGFKRANSKSDNWIDVVDKLFNWDSVECRVPPQPPSISFSEACCKTSNANSLKAPFVAGFYLEFIWYGTTSRPAVLKGLTVKSVRVWYIISRGNQESTRSSESGSQIEQVEKRSWLNTDIVNAETGELIATAKVRSRK
jgi:hypothetical protein